MFEYILPELGGNEDHPCLDRKEEGRDPTIWGVWERRNVPPYADIEWSYFYFSTGWMDDYYANYITETQAYSQYPVIDEANVLWAEGETPDIRVYYSRPQFEGSDWRWTVPDFLSRANVNSRYPQCGYYHPPSSWLSWLHMIWTCEEIGGQYAVMYNTRLIMPSLPIVDADVGQGACSPYTEHRDGYLSYGDLPCEDIDYGYDHLEYSIPDLDSNTIYWLELSTYHETADTISQFVVVENETLASQTLAPYQPEYVAVEVPVAAVADGEMHLLVLKDQGDFSVLGILRLYKYEEEEGRRGEELGNPVEGSLQVGLSVKDARVEGLFLSASPNPSKRSTRIQVDIPRGSEVSIAIFDLAGRPIKHVSTAYLQEGRHFFLWEGEVDSGGFAPSGVYLCRAVCGKECATAKVVLSR